MTTKWSHNKKHIDSWTILVTNTKVMGHRSINQTALQQVKDRVISQTKSVRSIGPNWRSLLKNVQSLHQRTNQLQQVLPSPVSIRFLKCSSLSHSHVVLTGCRLSWWVSSTATHNVLETLCFDKRVIVKQTTNKPVSWNLSQCDASTTFFVASASFNHRMTCGASNVINIEAPRNTCSSKSRMTASENINLIAPSSAEEVVERNMTFSRADQIHSGLSLWALPQIEICSIVKLTTQACFLHSKWSTKLTQTTVPNSSDQTSSLKPQCQFFLPACQNDVKTCSWREWGVGSRAQSQQC